MRTNVRRIGTCSSRRLRRLCAEGEGLDAVTFIEMLGQRVSGLKSVRLVTTAAAVETAATSLILLASPELFGRLFSQPVVRTGPGARSSHGNSPPGLRIGVLANPPRGPLLQCSSTICSQPSTSVIWVSRERPLGFCCGQRVRYTWF